MRRLQVAAAGPGDVLAADGHIFAAPKNLAALPRVPDTWRVRACIMGFYFWIALGHVQGNRR